MTKPLKINILIHRPSMSGGARVIARYARMLKERGHTVTITGLGAPPRTLRGRLANALGVRAQWRESSSHFRLEGHELALIDGAEAITANDLPDADVVVASFWLTAEWMATLPPEKGAHIYFVQAHEATLPHADKDRAIKTYALPARLITVSNWLDQILRDEYGRDDVAIVLNGIDIADFAPAAERRRNETPTIGFVYSRNPLKRSDIAINAAKALKARIPDLRVKTFAAKIPVGKNPFPDWFEVSINPSATEIAAIYAGCDVWLFTSDEEGYGLPLLESLASGTPLVARPTGAAPDLVTGENGVIVDSANPEAIAEAAARLLALPAARWKAMSDAALETARANDWANSLQKFEAELISAAQNRRNR